MKHFDLESQLLKQGYDLIIGCDEVGRGSLAGPVVAAAVSFEKPTKIPAWWNMVDDSKKLSPSSREEIARKIIECASGWGIGTVSNAKIDGINIHNASLRAMSLAVGRLAKKHVAINSHVLVDGKFRIPDWQGSQAAVVRGDSEIHSIAAASIIAKVYRDKLMKRLHNKYPVYGFKDHKGYATLVHRRAIKDHGLSSVHRVSFCGNIV
jgi:ribonuclease HII